MRRLFGLAALLVAGRANAHSKHCVETGAAVGETQCTRFGFPWATERSIPFFAGAGVFSTFVQSPIAAQFGGAGGARSLGVDSAQLSHGALRGYGGDLRVGGHLSPYVYLGFGFGFALGANASRTVEAGGYRVALRDGVNLIHARFAPFVGVRAPLGRVSLRAELAPALQAQIVLFKAYAADGSQKPGSGGGIGLILEPRVAVDYWLTPDTTLSLWSGANAMRPGDLTFGLTLLGHLRAFDGAF